MTRALLIICMKSIVINVEATFKYNKKSASVRIIDILRTVFYCVYRVLCYNIPIYELFFN